MTSHHDVAVVVAELQHPVAMSMFLSKDHMIAHLIDQREAAVKALEAQAKALSEAEAEVDRLTKRLDLLAVGFGVPDGGKYIADWQTRIAKYKAALATEGRLADLSRAMTEVRDWLILAGDMTCREIPLGIIARAFTNAAKEKT